MIFKSLAEIDLEENYVNLHERSPIAAKRFAERFLLKCRQIQRFPKSGRTRDDLRPGL